MLIRTAGFLQNQNRLKRQQDLGGLTALVPYFDRMLEMAFDQLDTCSGDPLCLEAKFSHPRKVNGAACYGCAMNSETSCEHRNMWLDRHVLMGNVT